MNGVTVFTPTYNRGYILSNAYKSLQRQSLTNFEWFIIDDASEDNTEELVTNWLKEVNSFHINYHRFKNGMGKHRALDYACSYAENEAILILDSDDYLLDDAIEWVINNFSRIVGGENIVA